MTKLIFKGTTVLITGASSGIGKEFALSLAKKGANLIITARSLGELDNLAGILTAENTDIWVKTIAVDLSTLNGSQTLFSSVNKLGLSVDYLINNAGFGMFSEFTNEPFETYHKMMMLNMNALVELSYLFLPKMKTENNGGIINVASVASFQPLPYMAVYGASKAFVLNFSEALSGELSNTNINVMALCPGTTESRFMVKANADTSSVKLAPASKVVADALAAFEQERMYIISGKRNYFMSLIPRLASRKLTVNIASKMLKAMVLKKPA